MESYFKSTQSRVKVKSVGDGAKQKTVAAWNRPALLIRSMVIASAAPACLGLLETRDS